MHSTCQRADICGVASATSAEIADAFGLRNATEVGELFSRRLDGLHPIRELGESREAGGLICSSESGRLSRQRNIDRGAHLAQYGQHSLRLLLAVRADQARAGRHHLAGAFRYPMAVARLIEPGAEAH